MGTSDEQGMSSERIQREHPEPTRPQISRRTAVRAGLALAGAMTVAGEGVARSATARQMATPGADAGTAAAQDGVLVSSVEGVPNAYLRMPTSFTTTSGVPGSGGTVRMFTISYAPPPTPRDSNTYWQELEKRLGVTWEPTLVPASGYGEKATAVIAGGDIPELFFLLISNTAPVISQSLSQGAFTDLTPYLTGDALKEYPNLAQFPQLVWDNVRYNGKIYGVPKQVLRSNDVAFYRSDWRQTLGMAAPASTDDVFNMLVAFAKNDPDGNGKPDTWGLAGSDGSWNMFLIEQLFRAPYGWRLNADGTLTNQIETDEYKQAVTFAAKLYAAGAYHPDTAGMQYDTEVSDFKAGTIGLNDNGFAAFFGKGLFIDAAHENNPKSTMDPLIPVGPDGQPAVTYAGQGFFGSVGIPANVGSDEGKVKELLMIIDYLSSPFGSEENTFLRYGLAEHHDTLPDGSLQKNDKGAADIADLVYPFLSENYFFFPGAPDDARRAQQINEQMAKIAITNPTAGLTSQTAIEQAGVLGQLGTDKIANLITGRDSIDTFDAYVQEWRSRGGDQIRTELEEALRKKNGG